MLWKRLLAALGVALIVPTVAYADSSQSLEVLETRADAFPHVATRLRLTADDPTMDLSQANLRVVENGHPQPSAQLVQLRNPNVPASVALAVDVAGSMADEDKMPLAKQAALRFIQQMRPIDQIALISFGDEVSVPQSLTHDRNLLANAINKLSPTGNSSLYEGMAQSLTQLSLAPNSTKALIVVTDGLDTQSIRTFDDVIAQANRMAVPVYTIGLGSDADGTTLQQLATRTGGRYYQAPASDDLNQAFRLISRQLNSQFEVSWTSTARGTPDQQAAVQLTITPANSAPLTTSFTYSPPDFGRSPRSEPSNPSTQLTQLAPTSGPTTEQELGAGLVAAAATLLFVLGLALRRTDKRLAARLAFFVAGRPAVSPQLLSRRTHVLGLTAAAAQLTARVLPDKLIYRLRRKLVEAGYQTDRHLHIFLAAELVFTLTFGLAGYQLLTLTSFASQSSSLVTLLLSLMLAMLGAYIPLTWLRRRATWRQNMILRALPDALDLMTISVTAGLSLDSAMAEVAQKWDGELSREFTQVLTEMQMGASRREALRNLADRNSLEDLRLIVAALLQADELGSNISDVLGAQADQMRVRRRQIAEEKARKAPVKMLFPIAIFIFPAMFVVILAPAVIQIMGMFSSFQH